MKWVWWIGGAFAYIVYKTEIGTGTAPHFTAQFIILLVGTLMGGRAARLAKEREQSERDERANEINRELEEKARIDKSSDGLPPA